MKSHFLKENDVVLSSRWQFEDGRSKGMGTEWDQDRLPFSLSSCLGQEGACSQEMRNKELSNPNSCRHGAPKSCSGGLGLCCQFSGHSPGYSSGFAESL